MNPHDLSRLLSLVSHEVRSPFGVMRGYLRLLQQTKQALSDQQQAAVDAALKAGDRVADLLGQLSMLAQLHRGDVPTDRRPVALVAMLDVATRRVRLPDDPPVRLVVPDVVPAEVLADESLLGAALSSLITAVVRAQPAEATVSVFSQPATRDTQRGARLVIAPRADVPDAASEEDLDIGRGGLGFELPLAAAIIHAHGGRAGELRLAGRSEGVIVWLPTL
jgi:signal transduction histidine kinase